LANALHTYEFNSDPKMADVIRIVSMEECHLPQVRDVLKDAYQRYNSLLCFSVNESLRELRERYSKTPEAKLKLGAVALSDTENVVGCVQMTTRGLPTFPEDFHFCANDEMYIETLAVSSDFRGKGIGTKLLEWCKQTALDNPLIKRLTLELVNGNRAIRLFERFGFEAKSLDDCVAECLGAVVVCCYFGRPYGICNENWGAVLMEMHLVEGSALI